MLIIFLPYLVGEAKNDVSEYIIFTRFCAVVALYGFDKLALKVFSKKTHDKISVEFMFSFFKRMILPYILLYVLCFLLLLIFSYDLILENVYFLLIVPFASCIEMLAFILRARGILITSQFVQYGLFSIVFTFFTFLTNDYLKAFFISNVIGLALAIFIFYLQERSSILWKFTDTPRFFEQTSYSFNTFTTISVLVVMLLNGTDLMIYKMFYSDYIHDYASIIRIAGLLSLPLVINNNHFVVEIVEWFNKDKKKLKRAYMINRSSSFKLSLGFFGILLIAFVAGRNILDFELNFVEILLMLTLLMLGKLYNNYVGGVNNLLMLCNKEQILMRNNLIALSICLAIYSVLIYYFMIWGLVISNVLLLLIINYLNQASCKKYIFNDSL